MGKIYFEEELEMIESEEVRQIVIDTLKNVKDEFYHAPASSTGKYHPEYALGDGGLYRHTRAAVKIANDILNLEWFKTNPLNTDYELNKDLIIAALILHDTCKSGKDWDSKYTRHSHPIEAANLIIESANGDLFSNHYKISRLIASHMGQWNEPPRYAKFDDRAVLPKPSLFDEFIVHLCDYLASRKYLEVKGLYEETESVSM